MTGSSLLISYQKPYHPVTRDTVTRWINNVVKKAGIDVTEYSTHSCRATALLYFTLLFISFRHTDCQRCTGVHRVVNILHTALFS